MKKTFIIFGAVFILVTSMQFAVSAKQSEKEISVVIPDYEIMLDDASVYYYDSLYPFLNYKGVTYFPATFEYCKSMDLACGFIENEAFCFYCIRKNLEVLCLCYFSSKSIHACFI